MNTILRKSAIVAAFACAIGMGTAIADAATFQYGDYDPGNAATSPPGISYDFTGLGFSFSTNPVAFQWGHYLGDNPPPDQNPDSVQANVAAWTGLDVTSVIEQLDSMAEGTTGFSTTLLAEIIAVHVGQGEFVFIFSAPTLFTLSNYAHCGNCPNGVIKVGGLSNFRTYNYTDNDQVIPLPAGIVLLLSALGGLGLLTRFKKTGAAA